MRALVAMIACCFAALPVAAGEREQRMNEHFRRMGLPPPDWEKIARAEKQRGVEAVVVRIMIAVEDCPGYVIDDRNLVQALMQAGSAMLPTQLLQLHEQSMAQAATADEPARTDCSTIFARFGHPGLEFAGAIVPVPGLLAAAPARVAEPQPSKVGARAASRPDFAR